MIKIKVCDTAPRNACSYYRGLGVLTKLRHLDPDIQVEYLEAVSWTALSDCDILFLIRPVEPNYLETMKLAKQMKVPVWIDFDDLLHAIPKDNPGYNYFQDRLDNIVKAVTEADVVTVSTKAIKQAYSYIRPDIKVIENAFNDYNYSLDEKKQSNRLIMWRGSATHRQDLLSCKKEMVNAGKNFPDWEWFFIGCDTWYISDYIEKSSIYAGELMLPAYKSFIYTENPSILICPLAKNAFNNAKSNIAWMEATYAGAACLAPGFLDEFQRPGVVTYTDNFQYLLEKLIKSKNFRTEQREKSLTYIKENLMLSKINQKRLEIVKAVIK